MKKIKALVCAVSALLLFVGCGGENSSSLESAFSQEPPILIYEEKADGLYVKCEPYHKESLTSVEIPATYEGKPVVGISDYGFEYCSALKSVTFPESLKKIGKTAFFNCPLESVVVPEGVIEIDVSAFSWCNQLTQITLPQSLQTVGKRAFWYCTALTEIEFGDSVTSIGEEAFCHCGELNSVTLGAGLESIGTDAFASVEGLETVEYTGEISAWCSIVFESQLSNPVWLTKRLYIDGNAVQSIVIEEGVEEILKFSFAGMQDVKTVSLPLSLQSIELNAFLDCNAVTHAYYNGTEDDWKDVSFVEAGNAIVKKNLYYYSETAQSGKFWRYENGIPTVWA